MMNRLAKALPLLLIFGPAAAQNSSVLPNGSDRAPAFALMLPTPDGARASPPSSSNPLPIGGPSGSVVGTLVAISTTPVIVAPAASTSRFLLEITNTGTVEIDCSMGGTPSPGTGNYDPLLSYGSQVRYASPGFVPTNAVSCISASAGASAYVKLVQQ